MSKNIHRKRFANGRQTPQEMHAELTFPPNTTCNSCSNRPMVRAIVMAPLDELKKRGTIHPELPLNDPWLSTVRVMIREGNRLNPYVRVSVVYACSSCSAEMEKALAKGPSWCIHEINRGPDPTNKIILGDG